MAVKIVCISKEPAEFKAFELENGNEIVVKNWYEKSKSKWHCVLAPNSANRKYVAHNEILAHLDENDEYVVEDKTEGPRTLGTSQPDKKLVPYMTAEDKEKYDAIIARAIENRNAQAHKPLTEEEKIDAQIAKLQAKRAMLLAQAALADTLED